MIDPRLDALGITVERYSGAGGCWRLVEVRYLDETESGGTHHIFYAEPHDPALSGEVCNQNECWTIPLDKPANEPAGNHQMYDGNIYLARMAGAPSDAIRGMRMTGEHGRDHVSFVLTFAWVEETEPQPPAHAVYLPLVGR